MADASEALETGVTTASAHVAALEVRKVLRFIWGFPFASDAADEASAKSQVELFLK
jgi:hypothetical protein